jgi:hypothetical protein
MEGGEYITVDLLEAKWAALLGAWRSEVRSTPGTVQEILARKNSAWHVVGRVHFHLAENKRNQEHPFAFLATYTTGLSAQGNPQHRPLGQALRESSSVRDKSRLLALLLPVKKAAEKSDFLKELVDAGHIFQPLSWTPRDAHRFLQHVPAFELLFVLRGVDQLDLISEAGQGVTIGDASRPANVLKDESLSGIFGIEMDGNGQAVPETKRPGRARREEAKLSRKARVTNGSVAARTIAPRGKPRGMTVSSRALIARGLRHSVIQNWLRSGVLLHTRSRGIYLKTRETEPHIEKYLKRIPLPVGRAGKPPP